MSGPGPAAGELVWGADEVGGSALILVPFLGGILGLSSLDFGLFLVLAGSLSATLLAGGPLFFPFFLSFFGHSVSPGCRVSLVLVLRFYAARAGRPFLSSVSALYLFSPLVHVMMCAR